MQNKLVIMLKFPRLGTVKTRLIPALGERRACELYRDLVRHTLDEVKRLTQRPAVNGASVRIDTLSPLVSRGERAGERGNPEIQSPPLPGPLPPPSSGGEGEVACERVSVEVRITGAPGDAAVREWLGDGIHFQPQGDGDLGQRMERAMRDAFAGGASSVVVIGADCPRLTSEHLKSTFGALAHADAVLGPAEDGGYYLIGMRKFVPELFRGIQWGGEQVLEQTLAIARERKVGIQLLETLHDLDRPEDLPLWARTAAARAAGKGEISVIIPAYNEAEQLRATIEAAKRGRPYEIIVVDGGSTDRTRETARSSDAIVLSAPRCRATQMNIGAAVATGEHLLFLHADTLLPTDYATHVRAVLDQPGVAGGAFRFAIAGEFPGRTFIEDTTNWRAGRRQLPYGDQALFLRQEVFAQLGGFREMSIMEDYEFVRRLRRFGKIVIAPSPAMTSARRWQRLGVVRTTLINRLIILAYHLGVSPGRLAAWYRRRSSQPEAGLGTARIEPQTVESRVG